MNTQVIGGLGFGSGIWKCTGERDREKFPTSLSYMYSHRSDEDFRAQIATLQPAHVVIIEKVKSRAQYYLLFKQEEEQADIFSQGLRRGAHEELTHLCNLLEVLQIIEVPANAIDVLLTTLSSIGIDHPCVGDTIKNLQMRKI